MGVVLGVASFIRGMVIEHLNIGGGVVIHEAVLENLEPMHVVGDSNIKFSG